MGDGVGAMSDNSNGALLTGALPRIYWRYNRKLLKRSLMTTLVTQLPNQAPQLRGQLLAPLEQLNR